MEWHREDGRTATDFSWINLGLHLFLCEQLWYWVGHGNYYLPGTKHCPVHWDWSCRNLHSDYEEVASDPFQIGTGTLSWSSTDRFLFARVRWWKLAWSACDLNSHRFSNRRSSESLLTWWTIIFDFSGNCRCWATMRRLENEVLFLTLNLLFLLL